MGGGVASARLALRLDLELVRGVPGLHGTDSGPHAHLRRGSKPVGGAKIFFSRCFSKFCTLVFRSGVRPSQWTHGGP
jgi:hypothetical protein